MFGGFFFFFADCFMTSAQGFSFMFCRKTGHSQGRRGLGFIPSLLHQSRGLCNGFANLCAKLRHASSVTRRLIFSTDNNANKSGVGSNDLYDARRLLQLLLAG